MQTIAQRYVRREKLGQGGMGTVYRAYDRLTGQDVALKGIGSGYVPFFAHPRPPKTEVVLF